ncbi:serine protease [Roseomonas sp. 18066]|uniref:S1 family peptidase n=1 Tax=Roseomonas sp. 18066 TaxID=2681412 RepID=UPI0013569BFC|nr:serine protease [Roseomonas sp. 18066]
MRRAAIGRRGFLVAGAGALLSACAVPAAREAIGTPAERIAATGFAVLRQEGADRGSVVGFGDHHVLTCAHVLGRHQGGFSLRRGDGAEVAAQLVGRSGRMDLAVLRVGPGFLAPPPVAGSLLPTAGEAVWAAGAPGIGASVAAGRVEAPDAEMPGYGRGFTARMPALMGYSGGPVVDRQGQLMGLTTALPQGGQAALLALLTGADLDGLLRRDRQVFVLSIHRAQAEAALLLGSTAA